MSNVWYGSLNNRLAERSIQPKPEIGMGVTQCCYSDRHPWEIIEVKDEKHITIRQMGCERIDKNGMSDCQEYRYFSKPDGGVKHLVLRNGRWRDRIEEAVYEEDPNGEYVRLFDVEKKRYRKVGYKVTNKLGCDGWSLGRSEEYYDFTFYGYIMDGIKKFIEGKDYKCRMICDSDIVLNFRVVKRTEKTVTLLDLETGETSRKRPNVWDGQEVCFPLGYYSMCPILRA